MRRRPKGRQTGEAPAPVAPRARARDPPPRGVAGLPSEIYGTLACHALSGSSTRVQVRSRSAAPGSGRSHPIPKQITVRVRPTPHPGPGSHTRMKDAQAIAEARHIMLKPDAVPKLLFAPTSSDKALSPPIARSTPMRPTCGPRLGWEDSRRPSALAARPDEGVSDPRASPGCGDLPLLSRPRGARAQGPEVNDRVQNFRLLDPRVEVRTTTASTRSSHPITSTRTSLQISPGPHQRSDPPCDASSMALRP
jgi:hypothetical protein